MKRELALKGLALAASMCLIACAVPALGAQQVQASGSLTTMDADYDEWLAIHENAKKNAPTATKMTLGANF